MTAPSSDIDSAALFSRAEDLKKKRNNDHPPIVIEFAGSPKAGKTTNIEIIDHFFKRAHFKVWAPTEGVSKRTPYHLRRDLVAYNSWSLNYAISELLVAYFNVDRQDLVILDRGPFDSLAWMGVLNQNGDLTDEDLSTIKNFALLPKWASTINRIYLFTCNPDVSLDREHNFKLTRRAGIAMNPTMLTHLLEHYKTLEQELKNYPVIRIDTTASTKPIDTARNIVVDIIEICEEKWK